MSFGALVVVEAIFCVFRRYGSMITDEAEADKVECFIGIAAVNSSLRLMPRPNRRLTIAVDQPLSPPFRSFSEISALKISLRANALASKQVDHLRSGVRAGIHYHIRSVQ